MMLWDYLWEGKQPLVNRQTICLNFENGGVNMINLRHCIEAKRIKFIHKIVNSKPEHWNMIGKYWLSCLDKRYDTENFLLQCSNIKGLHLPIPSIFYKDAITSWCTYRGKLQTQFFTPILKEQICGNNQILHRNIPLWFEQFSKSGLKFIKHIWDRDRMDFVEENVVLQRLDNKRNAIKHYRLIKSGINEGWLDCLKSNTNQRELSVNESNYIQKCLYINLGKDVKISSKQIQYILKNYQFKPKYMTKWESVFDTIINWKNQWTYSLETPLSNIEKQLHWKIMRNAIFTEYKLSLMGKSEGKCHFCKVETEYLTHLFYDCNVIKEVLNNIEAKVNNTLLSNGYQRHFFDLQNVIVGVEKKEECVRVFLNTILHIFKWELWKIRNLIKYEHMRYTSRNITKIILNKIKTCRKFWAVTKVASKQKNALDLLQNLESDV